MRPPRSFYSSADTSRELRAVKAYDDTVRVERMRGRYVVAFRPSLVYLEEKNERDYYAAGYFAANRSDHTSTFGNHFLSESDDDDE